MTAVLTSQTLKATCTFLLLAAIVLIQCLIGGTRLVFSLPSYGLIATAALATLGSWRRSEGRPVAACLWASAIVFSYVLWRAAFSPMPYLAWSDFYMVIACLMVYLLTALHLSDAVYRRLIVIGLLALAMAEVLVALRQFKDGNNWMPFGFMRSNYGARASGMFISSIHLAGYLEAVGILGLSFAVWSKWPPWGRVVAGYAAGLCYVGVALTGSRGGYLSSAFSLVVFAGFSVWIRRRAHQGRILGVAAGLALALIAVFALAIAAMQQSPLLRERLGLIGKPDVRIYNWQAALDQFKLSPWIGTGAGTHLYFGRLFRRPQIQADPEHAHSDYLEMLAEYGLVGLAGMAAFVFIHLQAAGSNALSIAGEAAVADRRDTLRDDRLALQIGAIGAIASYAAHSVTDFNLHIPGNALVFAFIFGICASPGVASGSSEARPANWVRIFQCALPMLGLWMFLNGLPKYPAERLAEKTRVAVRDRNFSQAATLGRSALALERRNPFIYFYLGEAYRGMAAGLATRVLREPHLKASAAYHRLALQLFPQDETAWLCLGYASDALRDLRAGEIAFQTALQLDPNLGVLHAAYASHLALVGRADEAREEARLGVSLSGQGGQSVGPWARSIPPDPEPTHGH